MDNVAVAACENPHFTASGSDLPLSSIRPLIASMFAACALVACSGVNLHFGAQREEPAPPKVTGYGEEASLRAIGGSAVFGKIRVIDRGERDASILVSTMNMPVGAYRIAIHDTPNCSSPNGFSAGAPWAPAGRDPLALIPVQYTNGEERVEASIRVAGMRAEGPNGVAGHSVVVYAGPDITPARPDVPNARIACGVFEPAQPLRF
jgi:Cu/Zn superoxide dismutase